MIEYTMLALAALLYQFVWLPHYLAKWTAYGYDHMVSNRNRKDLPDLPGWGARARRAQENYSENFLPFAIAVIVLGLLDGFNSHTDTATVAFFAARLCHLFIYTAGYVYLRSTVYTIGLVATLYLYYVLFTLPGMTL